MVSARHGAVPPPRQPRGIGGSFVLSTKASERASERLNSTLSSRDLTSSEPSAAAATAAAAAASRFFLASFPYVLPSASICLHLPPTASLFISSSLARSNLQSSLAVLRAAVLLLFPPRCAVCIVVSVTAPVVAIPAPDSRSRPASSIALFSLPLLAPHFLYDISVPELEQRPNLA